MKNLKLTLTAALIFVFAISQSIAQKATVKEIEYDNDKGQLEIQLGVGLMPTFVSKNADMRIPPLSMVLNYRFNKAFNLGAYLGYSSTEYTAKEKAPKDQPPADLFLQNDFYLVGLRAEGHFNRERIDFYGGAMLGYNFSKIKTNIEKPADRPEGIEIEEDGNGIFTYSGYIGLKYAVSPKVGVYGEIGYGVSLISLGVSYRL